MKLQRYNEHGVAAAQYPQVSRKFTWTYLAREMKKLVEHESDNNINHITSSGNISKEHGNGTEETGDTRKNQDHQQHSWDRLEYLEEFWRVKETYYNNNNNNNNNNI